MNAGTLLLCMGSRDAVGSPWEILLVPDESSKNWPGNFVGCVTATMRWPVFYEVGQELLPLYIDLGLTFLKLGEQARVRLDTFSLKGEAGKKFRHTINHIEKAGCTFSVIPGRCRPRHSCQNCAWSPTRG